MKNKTLKYIRQAQYRHNEGFALLIGVVLSAILISIAYTMFSISLKQVSLSTTGKNSQSAFYAADSGVECALYIDLNKPLNAFVNSTIDASGAIILSQGNNPSVSCNGLPLSYTTTVVNDSSVKTTFSYNTFGGISGTSPCTTVTVLKYIDPNKLDEIKTQISSNGYNACGSNTNPQKLERSLEVDY